MSKPLGNLGYPGHAADGTEMARLNKLAAFQKKALTHALSFLAVERVVYSVHHIENDDVVQSILPLAASLGFRLEAPFPQWIRQGLPVIEGDGHHDSHREVVSEKTPEDWSAACSALGGGPARGGGPGEGAQARQDALQPKTRGGLGSPSALPVGLPVKIQMDPKVMVSAGKLKSKRVAIRLTCEGFIGVVPQRKVAVRWPRHCTGRSYQFQLQLRRTLHPRALHATFSVGDVEQEFAGVLRNRNLSGYVKSFSLFILLRLESPPSLTSARPPPTPIQANTAARPNQTNPSIVLVVSFRLRRKGSSVFVFFMVIFTHFWP
ncbi:hypothetical protein NL676_036111 [Syzygium grande]|nr:hypothetical protein NL676_036111 [Syzygium grande]